MHDEQDLQELAREAHELASATDQDSWLRRGAILQELEYRGLTVEELLGRRGSQLAAQLVR